MTRFTHISTNFSRHIYLVIGKIIDCINHNLLIAKLEAYGFEKNALTFIYDYLKDIKQRTKINNSYRSWKDIK